MKLSIITPTHDTKYLKELEESILANNYQDWEWIILVNNGAKYKSTDERIRVVQSKTNSKSVGALKKEACSHATGEAIVEVDHDDLITPDCLVKIEKAFEDKMIGFVYSDNAKLSDDFVPYDPYWGWTWRHFNWNGKKLIAMNSLPLTPGRLGYIWYAPDHVRAWRTDIYNLIGGHNEELEICDDLDLMHRLYMVTRFKHIPEVLYIYRIDGKNTWLERNQAIQQKTREIYHKNIYSLADRYSRLNGLLMVDLCGGFNKPDGFLSIDLENGDIKADLDNGIPLQENSCGVVRAYDALEHLKDQQFIMKEIHRVLAPGGILLSHTPSTDGRGAWQDPTHVSFWNENSFWYWTRPQQMQYIRNKHIRFFESSLLTHFPSEWHKQHNISYVEAFLEKI
jgi:glycosyltransferase involved in cell wall biosynthesis